MPPLNTPLTSIQEIVERSIFHSIRAQCVAKGYLPDVLTFDRDEKGFRDYLDAFKPIITEKGYAIEVFNTGAPADRVSKQLPRIVLASAGYLPGSIGSDGSHQYELNNEGKYSKYHTPPTTSDLYINIHMVSASTHQHRLMGALMALAVPRMGYVKVWDSENEEWTEDYIFCRHLSYVPVRQHNNPGTMETIYRYIFPDLFEVHNIYTEDVVSPLEEINLELAGTNLKITKDE